MYMTFISSSALDLYMYDLQQCDPIVPCVNPCEYQQLATTRAMGACIHHQQKVDVSQTWSHFILHGRVQEHAISIGSFLDMCKGLPAAIKPLLQPNVLTALCVPTS